MTDVVATFVRCSCGELIGICNATCPQCGAPHTRVLTPASSPSAPVPPAVSGGDNGGVGPTGTGVQSATVEKRQATTCAAPAPPHHRRDEGAPLGAQVENRRDLTTAERGYVMPVGIDRDAEIFEDLRGFDPDCRIFLEDEHHRCTRNTGQPVRLGESCFYSANRAVRRAS